MPSASSSDIKMSAVQPQTGPVMCTVENSTPAQFMSTLNVVLYKHDPSSVFASEEKLIAPSSVHPYTSPSFVSHASHDSKQTTSNTMSSPPTTVTKRFVKPPVVSVHAASNSGSSCSSEAEFTNLYSWPPAGKVAV